MRITIDMPPKVYGALATKADERGVKLGALLAETAAGLIERPKPGRKHAVTPDLGQRIQTLAALNWSAFEIGQRLGLGETTVRKHMRETGIAPLRRTKA